MAQDKVSKPNSKFNKPNWQTRPGISSHKCYWYGSALHLAHEYKH